MHCYIVIEFSNFLATVECFWLITVLEKQGFAKICYSFLLLCFVRQKKTLNVNVVGNYPLYYTIAQNNDLKSFFCGFGGIVLDFFDMNEWGAGGILSKT